MKNKVPLIAVGIVVLLIIVIGAVVIQKSLLSPEDKSTITQRTKNVKKVDLASQPEWVQKLEVTAAKGQRSGTRGLDKVTVSVSGFPKGMVSSLTYTMAYAYKTAQGEGSGGFFTDTPVEIGGKENFRRTFDFGTCSTKSCVRHDGVTSMDVEIDFLTKDGDEPIWSGTVAVK